MVEYNKVNVKLTYTQLKILKNAFKNKNRDKPQNEFENV